MARYQLISGPERRRRWSEEQKRALVAAAFAPGAIGSRPKACCTCSASPCIPFSYAVHCIRELCGAQDYAESRAVTHSVRSRY